MRPDRADTLEDLIQQLFARRNTAYIARQQRMWLTAELVQSLRRKSDVYRRVSEKTDGPLPFALGYFSVRDGRLTLTTDTVPAANLNVVARLLSEFLEPGATLWYQGADTPRGWRIVGEDDLDPVTASAAQTTPVDPDE